MAWHETDPNYDDMWTQLFEPLVKPNQEPLHTEEDSIPEIVPRTKPVEPTSDDDGSLKMQA